MNKTHYQIIKDEQALKAFIEWLPELGEGQEYYVSLFARNKYGGTEGLKADRSQIKRFTATKKTIFSKIKKLEVALGEYEVDGLKINEESLAMYITPNPRDLHKSGLKALKEFADILLNDRKILKPHSIVLNQIQVTGKKIYYDVDVDIKKGKQLSPEGLIEFLDGVINKEAVRNIIQTHGGFHVLVELDKITDKYKKSWHQGIANLRKNNEVFDVMMNGDNMIPLVGCVQSTAIPKHIINE